MYTPQADAKTYDKPINKKHNNKHFNPKQVLQLIAQGPMPEYLDEEGKKNLIGQFIEVM